MSTRLRPPSSMDPVDLRDWAEKVCQELERLQANVTGELQTSGEVALVAGGMRRCSPPPDGMAVVLPAPSPENAGQLASLFIESPLGSVTVTALPHVDADGSQRESLVNGASTATFTLEGGVSFRSNGVDRWVSTSELPSESVALARASGALPVGAPTGAEYHLRSANAQLPSARVATQSTEIDPDYGTAGLVSWVLRASSVVLAKLQDLTGLSVLGRAANSTGVMSAITASSARQVLQVNDAGTSLAWGDPVEVRERGTDVGDAYALDVVNGPGMTGHASVSSRVGSLQFCLAAHRIKTEPATGIIDTSDWNDYDAIYFTGAQPEVQNIPQPTDPDGNAYEKVLWLLGSTVVAPLTIRHNTGTGTGRIFCPNLRDSEQFQLSSSQLVYNTVENRWFIVANTSVVAEANNDGTLLIGRSLNFMNAPAGLTWSLAKVAGEIRITPTLANIPLTALANQADDTWLGNISGGSAPPTANTLSGLAGNGFSYNAITHAFDIGTGTKIGVTADAVTWLGMEGRISGADAGDFVGIDFTNGSGNVTFSLDTGAGGTFGVVANVTNLPLSDLEDISPGEVLGLQVDAGGDAAPVALTGLEQGENVRFNNISVIALTPGGGSGSGGEYVSTDFASNITSTTTHVVFTMTGTGTAEIDGFPAITGKILFVRASTLASDQAISWTNLSAEQVSVDGTGRIRVAEGPRVWDQTGASGIVAYGNSVYDLLEAPPADGSIENAKLADGSATGQIKQWNGSAWTNILLSTAVDSDAPGRLIQITEYSSGSGTHTYNSATARVFVQLVHGGGGGGSAASCSSAQASAGGGGGGSRLSESWMTPGGATDSYSVGAGGSAGTAGGSGGAGGASSFGSFSPSNATGLGGAGGAATGSGVLRFAAGGGNNTGNGGSPGGHGVAIGGSGSTGASAGGVGGPGPWGGGGGGATIIENGATGTGTGVFGTTPGGGGSGASNVGTGSNVNGGGGAGGFIRVWEFT